VYGDIFGADNPSIAHLRAVVLARLHCRKVSRVLAFDGPKAALGRAIFGVYAREKSIFDLFWGTFYDNM